MFIKFLLLILVVFLLSVFCHFAVRRGFQSHCFVSNHYNDDFWIFFRDLDKIDSLMQDITEQQEIAQEISDAISQPFGDQFDEVQSEDQPFYFCLIFMSIAFISCDLWSFFSQFGNNITNLLNQDFFK